MVTLDGLLHTQGFLVDVRYTWVSLCGTPPTINMRLKVWSLQSTLEISRKRFLASHPQKRKRRRKNGERDKEPSKQFFESLPCASPLCGAQKSLHPSSRFICQSQICFADTTLSCYACNLYFHGYLLKKSDPILIFHCIDVGLFGSSAALNCHPIHCIIGLP